MLSEHIDPGQGIAPPLDCAAAVAAIEDFTRYAHEKGLGETERLLALILVELRRPPR